MPPEVDKADLLGPSQLMIDLVNQISGLKDLNIIDAVTDAVIEQTIEGASNLTVTVRDPGGDILNSGYFERAFDVRVDKLWFRYCGLEKNDDNLDIIFEDRYVAWIKQHKAVKTMSRNSMTRIQFCIWLVKQLKKEVAYIAPEVNVKKAVGGSAAKKINRAAEEERVRASGISRDADLQVKGSKATRAQIAAMETVLNEAYAIPGMIDRAVLAMICANIGESEYKRGNTNPKSGAKGIFQILPRYWHLVSWDDLHAGVNIFMKQGFTWMPNTKVDWDKYPASPGGALSLAKNHPDYSPGAIAGMVEGSDQGGHWTTDAPVHDPRRPPDERVLPGRQYVNPFYDAHLPEAKKILEAYGGQGEKVAARQFRKQYRFTTRDKNGKAQNWWDAIGGLMDEVQSRRFMSNGVLYLASDEYLFKSKHRMTISEQTEGVIRVNFTFDTGKKLSTCQVRARAERWIAPPGSTIMLEDAGPASGKWLVTNIRRSLFSPECEITLSKPQNELPEPPSEIITRDEPATSGVRTGGKYGKTETLKGIQLDSRWGGTLSIFEQFVTPFMADQGLKPGSQKRTPAENAAVGGAPHSSHLTTEKDQYAIDYPTSSGLEAAQKLAHKIGWKDWQSNSYNTFNTIVANRYTFEWQILWGAAIEHGDHVHVGIKRVRP